MEKELHQLKQANDSRATQVRDSEFGQKVAKQVIEKLKNELEAQIKRADFLTTRTSDLQEH